MGLFLGEREKRSGNGVTPWLPEPPIAPFPGSTISGKVTAASKPDVALQTSTVWGCVSLLAGAVATLELETFRKTTDPTAVPKRIPDPPLITEPDYGMDQAEWLYMLMVSLLLRGNGIGRIIDRDQLGHPTKVHLLDPDKVQIRVDRTTGALIYENLETGKPIPFQDVWHVRGMTLPGQQVGLSPIAYAAAHIGLDLASREFANGFFDGGGIPKAVLESDQRIDQAQAKTLKERLLASVRGREPLVLGLGTKYTAIQVKPEESQFLATQKATPTQICRYFSVPAAMVDAEAGGGMQYSNTEQRAIEFLTYSLGRWLRRLEGSVFRLLPGQQYVKFNPRNLLRLDAKTQSDVDLKNVAAKKVAPSELRARDGMEPMTEAQKEEISMVPLQVSASGRVTGNVTPTADEAPVPEDEQVGA